MTDMNACENCGRPLHLGPNGWAHSVEPTGHEARPSRLVAIGRARAVEDIRMQMRLAVEKGQEITDEWVERWCDWFGDPERQLLATDAEANDAYRKAMGTALVPQIAQVKATFIDLLTDAETTKTLELSYDGRIVKLHGGPTGYEDFRASDRLPEHRGRDWVACAGTRGSWKRCVIDGASLSEALIGFGIEQPVEVSDAS